jgi:hypothetical protein
MEQVEYNTEVVDSAEPYETDDQTGVNNGTLERIGLLETHTEHWQEQETACDYAVASRTDMFNTMGIETADKELFL